jgi:hypothetical protein
MVCILQCVRSGSHLREQESTDFLFGGRHNRQVPTQKLIMADSRGAIVRAAVVAPAAS